MTLSELQQGLMLQYLARHLPDWLPFMERLRYAHTWRSAIENITSLPFEAALKLEVMTTMPILDCVFGR